MAWFLSIIASHDKKHIEAFARQTLSVRKSPAIIMIDNILYAAGGKVQGAHVYVKYEPSSSVHEDSH